MSRSATSSDARRVNAAVAVPLPDRLLFYGLVALLCARPLISETFERVELAPGEKKSVAFTRPSQVTSART